MNVVQYFMMIFFKLSFSFSFLTIELQKRNSNIKHDQLLFLKVDFIFQISQLNKYFTY